MKFTTYVSAILCLLVGSVSAIPQDASDTFSILPITPTDGGTTSGSSTFPSSTVPTQPPSDTVVPPSSSVSVPPTSVPPTSTSPTATSTSTTIVGTTTRPAVSETSTISASQAGAVPTGLAGMERVFVGVAAGLIGVAIL